MPKLTRPVEEAKESNLGWRIQAIRRRLTTDDGSIKTPVGVPDLRSTTKLVNKGYESSHLKRHHLQLQIKYLAAGAITVIFFIIAVSLLSTVVAIIPSPFFDFTAAAGGEPTSGTAVGNNTTATPTPTGTPSSATNNTTSGAPGDTTGSDQPDPIGFLLYIILFGMLGAALFGIRSIRKQPTATTTPQYLSSRQAATTRMIVGAASALAIFFFLMAGVLDINVGTNDSNGPVFITLAFVAGYSERLVHATVESVASTAVPDEADENAE